MSPVPVFLLITGNYRLALILGAPFLFFVLRFAKRWMRARKAAEPRLIRTYAASGRRLSDSSPERVERLLALGFVVVRRNRRGAITLMQFKRDAQSGPIHKHAHMGQHYSFEEPLPSGYYAWKHRELVRDERDLQALFGEKPDDREEADRFVRAIFRAVPLSCLATDRPKTPKPAAKIVDIGQWRSSEDERSHEPERQAA